jgi:hypothetical protein
MPLCIAESPATQPATTQPATRPAAKALSDQTKKGLAWLAAAQQADGGWDQGEIAKNQVRGGESEKSNIADTAMAALALLRSGENFKDSTYAPNLKKAVDFVCTQVEKSTQEGLSITDIRVTRLQSKLGPHIDTFSAALLLAEVRPLMPEGDGRKRVIAALDKVMDKIEKNQNKDGGFVGANEGWAAALCNSVANKALNKAAMNGAKVSDDALAKSQIYAGKAITSGGVVSAEGSANVELYARAANLQNLQDGDHVNQLRKKDLEDKKGAAAQEAQQAQQQLAAAQAANAPAATTRPLQEQLARAQDSVMQAESQLGAIRVNSENLKVAQAAVVERFNDQKFVAGFGNNGGEEFLSYMNVGESLLVKGGDDFVKWDKAMTENLQRIQNNDGSWSGHHCITGRTFCTSAALLTLMVDRSGPTVSSLKK